MTAFSYKKLAMTASLVGLLAGCGNPYRTNFNSLKDKYPRWLESRFAPSAPKPQLMISDDIQAANWDLVEKGYLMIGFSKFDLPAIDPAMALDEGKAVGADIVLVQRKYTKSLTETVTMTQWQPDETTEIRENTGIAGERGTKQVDRRVEIRTSRGPETVYVPQQVDYYEHSATYWRKIERPVFGAIVQDLTDSQKQKLQTNRGLNVRAIVIDSPAYQADLLKGDILLKINGAPVQSAQRFYDEMIQAAGKEVTFTILRGEKTLDRRVKLNP